MIRALKVLLLSRSRLVSLVDRYRRENATLTTAESRWASKVRAAEAQVAARDAQLANRNTDIQELNDENARLQSLLSIREREIKELTGIVGMYRSKVEAYTAINCMTAEAAKAGVIRK